MPAMISPLSQIGFIHSLDNMNHLVFGTSAGASQSHTGEKIKTWKVLIQRSRRTGFSGCLWWCEGGHLKPGLKWNKRQNPFLLDQISHIVKRKTTVGCGLKSVRFFFFSTFIYFWDRETEHERGRGRERGRHRIGSRLQALSHQPRARRGARTHGLRDRDLAEVGCLTDCATQAPPPSLLRPSNILSCVVHSILFIHSFSWAFGLFPPFGACKVLWTVVCSCVWVPAFWSSGSVTPKWNYPTVCHSSCTIYRSTFLTLLSHRPRGVCWAGLCLFWRL